MFQLQNYDPFPVNEKRLSQDRRIWNSKPEGGESYRSDCNAIENQIRVKCPSPTT
jgi:hypothetical protein